MLINCSSEKFFIVDRARGLISGQQRILYIQQSLEIPSY